MNYPLDTHLKLGLPNNTWRWREETTHNVPLIRELCSSSNFITGDGAAAKPFTLIDLRRQFLSSRNAQDNTDYSL